MIIITKAMHARKNSDDIEYKMYKQKWETSLPSPSPSLDQSLEMDSCRGWDEFLPTVFCTFSLSCLCITFGQNGIMLHVPFGNLQFLDSTLHVSISVPPHCPLAQFPHDGQGVFIRFSL